MCQMFDSFRTFRLEPNKERMEMKNYGLNWELFARHEKRVKCRRLTMGKLKISYWNRLEWKSNVIEFISINSKRERFNHHDAHHHSTVRPTLVSAAKKNLEKRSSERKNRFHERITDWRQIANMSYEQVKRIFSRRDFVRHSNDFFCELATSSMMRK